VWIDLGEQIAIGRRGRMVMDAMGTREFTDVVTAYEPGREVATDPTVARSWWTPAVSPGPRAPAAGPACGWSLNGCGVGCSGG